MKESRIAALAAAIFILGFESVAPANTVFLSGDSNIGNPIDGSELFAPIDPGNKQFFENILQGGSKVVILHDFASGLGTSMNAINTFYNTLPGVTSGFVDPAVTPASLFQADLLLVSTPGDDFTPDEIGAMRDFLAGGNSILFMGENAGFFDYNARINTALASLGIGMSLVDSLIDPGFHTVTGGRIIADPFTAGINTFTYAAPSEIALGPNAKSLFLSSSGTPVIAYATIPEPSMIMLALIGVAGLPMCRRSKPLRPQTGEANPQR